MRKKIILSAIFLGLAIFIFVPTNFANATLLTCGGDKTEADCTNAGGTVVNTGGCTSCSIVGATCPAGMTQYLNWAYYPSKSCGRSSEICNTGDCGTKCATGSICSVNSGWFNSNTHNCSYTSVYDGSMYTLVSPLGGSACNQCGVQYYDAYFFTMNSKNYVKCFKVDTNSSTCSSIKSNVACIGSGATPVAPTLNFSLSSSSAILSATIFKSMSFNLYWTPINATSCEASTTSSGAGVWSGSMAFNPVMHSMSITPTEIGTKIYNLECFNGAVSSGIKTVTVDVVYGAVSCTTPSCGSDCGVVKKSYCQDTYGNITPESNCGGGAGCDDVVCDSCQWKETSP